MAQVIRVDAVECSPELVAAHSALVPGIVGAVRWAAYGIMAVFTIPAFGSSPGCPRRPQGLRRVWGRLQPGIQTRNYAIPTTWRSSFWVSQSESF
jgi:hypothetical protein